MSTKITGRSSSETGRGRLIRGRRAEYDSPQYSFASVMIVRQCGDWPGLSGPSAAPCALVHVYEGWMIDDCAVMLGPIPDQCQSELCYLAYPLRPKHPSVCVEFSISRHSSDTANRLPGCPPEPSAGTGMAWLISSMTRLALLFSCYSYRLFTAGITRAHYAASLSCLFDLTHVTQLAA